MNIIKQLNNDENPYYTTATIPSTQGAQRVTKKETTAEAS